MDQVQAQTLPKCILVVEDDPMIRLFLKKMLEKLGYRVILAENGEEGLATARREAGQIDLIVSDVEMPKMTGCEMVAALRDEDASQTPIVIFSGAVQESECTCRAYADVAFVRKAGDRCCHDDLIKEINSALNSAQSR